MMDLVFTITYENDEGEVFEETAYSKEEANLVIDELKEDGYINIKMETIRT